MDTELHNIFLDFDSTLIRAESLDMLGDACGVGDQTRVLTARSMAGSVPLERVFKKKIDLIAPSRAAVCAVAQQCPALLVDHARDVVALLRALGKKVFILSSNFQQIIGPTAALLGIPETRIIANRFSFNRNGAYLGFTHTSPLCTSRGKAALLRAHQKRGEASAMVGDGSTDLSCKGVAHVFVGFGGVAVREHVRAHADAYCADPSFAPLLRILLTRAESDRARRSEYGALITRTHTTTVRYPNS